MAKERDEAGPTRSHRPVSFRAPSHSRMQMRMPAEGGPLSRHSSEPPPDSDTRMTARAALEAGGVARLRVLSVAMLLLIQVGMVAVALLEGERSMKHLAWGALAVLLALFIFAWLRLEQQRRVRRRELRLVAIPLCIAVVVANYAFGLVSTFSGAVTLGLMLFASSSSRKNARLAFSIIVGGFALAALYVRYDLDAYRPLALLHFAAPWQWDAGVVAVLCMYFAAYAAGRMMRREMARVVEQFEKAVREASYRDALFREARDAIKQVAGFGGPGRFTDQEIDGYRLGEVIGRGGMGEVYAAARLADGREAAVKLLRLDYLGDRSALTRFEREAAIAASISSPHVVQVLGVSSGDAVFPYLAMERLRGTDLGSYLRERGRLPLDEVCDMVRQVAAGLEAAHAGQIVHRDLKPSNIYRAEAEESLEPVWKILDFGVSKLSGSGDVTLTANELVGTPQYMAPEQARGERDLDARTDVYALAAIAFRALVGEPPFTAELPRLLTLIVETMPAAPSSRADLPQDIDLVLAVGLAKERHERFDAASAFAHALTRAAQGDLDEPTRRRALALLEQKPYSSG